MRINWIAINRLTRSLTRNYVNAFVSRKLLKLLTTNKPKYLYKFGLLGSSAVAITNTWYGNTPEDDIESNLAHLMIMAKIALESSDIDRAEALLQVALNLAEDHQMYTGVPIIYDILASIALAQGKVEKAEILLVEAIEKLLKFGYTENNHNIVDFRLKLARMYSMNGYNTMAEIGFRNCLEHQKEKINDGDLSDRTGLLYIHILFWYGVHKIRNAEYVEAKKLINNAFDYSTKIKGLSPKQEMVILCTLAEVNVELGDYEVALSSMLDAIILGKGIGSIDLPFCYLKLGRIYEMVNMKEKAKFSYEEAKNQGQLYGYGEVVTEAVLHLAELNQTDKR